MDQVELAERLTQDYTHQELINMVRELVERTRTAQDIREEVLGHGCYFRTLPESQQEDLLQEFDSAYYDLDVKDIRAVSISQLEEMTEEELKEHIAMNATIDELVAAKEND